MNNVYKNKLNTKNTLKFIACSALISLVVLTSSCAEINNVSTNLDRKNFEEYFAPTKVTIYEDEKDFLDNHYEYAGLVEGQDCQLKEHHAAPDPIRARTQARSKAHELGANAIVFSNCAVIDQSTLSNSSCLSTVICYGSAYKVDWEDSQ